MRYFLLSLFATICIYSNAQTVISASGQLGYAIPNGEGVGEQIDQFDVDGGITFGLDAMYHLMDSKLGVGIAYNRYVLASENLDAFGLSFVGVRGQYRFFPEKFSPFVGLALGLSTAYTPEVSSGGQVIVEEKTGSGFGVLGTLGLYFGKGFYLSADYQMPTSFTIDDTNIKDAALGALSIQLGYRFYFEF